MGQCPPSAWIRPRRAALSQRLLSPFVQCLTCLCARSYAALSAARETGPACPLRCASATRAGSASRCVHSFAILNVRRRCLHRRALLPGRCFSPRAPRRMRAVRRRRLTRLLCCLLDSRARLCSCLRRLRLPQCGTNSTACGEALCNSRGSCLSASECACFAGYFGPRCEATAAECRVQRCANRSACTGECAAARLPLARRTLCSRSSAPQVRSKAAPPPPTSSAPPSAPPAPTARSSSLPPSQPAAPPQAPAAAPEAPRPRPQRAPTQPPRRPPPLQLGPRSRVARVGQPPARAPAPASPSCRPLIAPKAPSPRRWCCLASSEEAS